MRKESALEILRKKPRDKKKRQNKDVQRQTKASEETQLEEHAEASQNLKLIDRPL